MQPHENVDPLNSQVRHYIIYNKTGHTKQNNSMEASMYQLSYLIRNKFQFLLLIINS